MSNAFEDLAGLDRLIHEPARLSIMTALAACQKADFLALQRLTGLTGGNLSTHLTRLEEAGWINQQKQFIGKKPKTQVEITGKGRTAVEKYWNQLEQLRREAREWKPEDG